MKLEGLNNPEVKKAIAFMLNNLIKDRLKHKPMGKIELAHYLSGVQDTYMVLTDCSEPFNLDEELANILKKNGMAVGDVTGIKIR